MKLIDQVITLEQAKRLKELGIRQDASHAAWLRNECHKETEFWCWPVEAQGISNRGYSSPATGCLEGFSAFTVAELGEMLPPGYDTMYCVNDGWRGFDLDGVDMLGSKAFNTEAEVRAAMLIHLIKTNVVTVDEINTWLCS